MYNDRYFSAGHFEENDYRSMATEIVKLFKPARVVEVGCGRGDLALELTNFGVEVLGLDGFGKPIVNSEKFTYINQDFNDTKSFRAFAQSQPKADLAICLEVAEHLEPAISPVLVNALCTLSDTDIFSAAVPGQGGTGHINCRDRVFWHRLFESEGFRLEDKIRKQFREHTRIAPWYQLNTLIYRRAGSEVSALSENLIIEELLLSESYAASAYFHLLTGYQNQESVLGRFPVKQFLILRQMARRVLGRA